MERNPGSDGGWRCVINRRAAQNAYHKRRMESDPDYRLDRNRRDMCRIRVRY